MDNSVDIIFKDEFSFIYQTKLNKLKENYKNQIGYTDLPEPDDSLYKKILSVPCEVIDLDYKTYWLPLCYVKENKRLRALELECDERDVVNLLMSSLEVNGKDMINPKLYIRLVYRICRFNDDKSLSITYAIG